MVKDHSDSERGNPLPPHGILFPINSKGSFVCTIPHTTAFVSSVVQIHEARFSLKHVLPCKNVKRKYFFPNRAFIQLNKGMRLVFVRLTIQQTLL